MMIKRFLTYGACAVLLVCLAPPVRSQSEEEEKKLGFFGDRFALMLEVGYGTTSLEELNVTNSTSLTRVTYGTLSFDDLRYGHAAVGWELPFDRGTFELHFDGYRENGYSLQATGNAVSVLDPVDQTNNENAALALPWWNLDVTDGNLSARLIPPFWSQADDDANGNGLADPNEVTYADPAFRTIDRGTFEDLDNRISTIDLRYRREFGGRKYGGAWSAGFRHFTYEGNLIIPTWLGLDFTSLGFTSGGLLDPIILHQETSGLGPTGSLGLIIRFLPEHLHFYADGRLAFVVQSLNADSGIIYGLNRSSTGGSVPGGGAFEYAAVGRIDYGVDKDSWQVTGEIGLRLLLGKGLTFELAMHRTSYQDSVLLPADIAIPENRNQVFEYPEGIERNFAALYQTEDLLVDAYRASVRFQF